MEGKYGMRQQHHQDTTTSSNAIQVPQELQGHNTKLRLRVHDGFVPLVDANFSKLRSL
jgi:hypothetical protein